MQIGHPRLLEFRLTIRKAWSLFDATILFADREPDRLQARVIGLYWRGVVIASSLTANDVRDENVAKRHQARVVLDRSKKGNVKSNRKHRVM
jgi:hypothetical protein